MEDECHLCWGDTCGYVWGKRNAAVGVPMLNQRQRQTYYGALNLLTGDFHPQAAAAGNGEHTVNFIQHCQSLYPGKRLLWLWDGASYHRGQDMTDFLTKENQGKEEADWKVTCMRFAPNAPEQNPVEDVWLQAKNHLRKQFAANKTFAEVKACFFNFLQGLSFRAETKFAWYWGDSQVI